MSDKAIIAEGITKKYRIGNQKTGSFREMLSGIFKPKPNSLHEFSALDDVSFTVNKGDSIGIIGRNGAGKSTLLKILSQITFPSKGRVEIFGRVGSLLEVGTGFHPELTGRENIFLNGTILGMSRSEVKSKFDEIVEFSGVEKFLDTTVKKYSSGMTVRLAFSVAAHLETEILIIDEVLAVGDAEFQKKCLGKMSEVSKGSGKTVLFVSHNLAAVAQLCNKGILLEKGKLKEIGNTLDVINKYYQSESSSTEIYDRRNESEWKGKIHFLTFGLFDASKNQGSEFKHDEGLYLVSSVYVPKNNPSLEFAFSVYDKLKNRIFTIHESLSKFPSENDVVFVSIKIEGGFLAPGSYSCIMCVNHFGVEMFDLHDDFSNFTIIDNGSDFYRYAPGSLGSVFAKYSIENLN